MARKSKQNFLGYVDLIIKHHWHGSRKNRQHLFRWLLLSKYDYDPSVDIKIELDGHYEMVSKKPKFMEKIEEYFIDRNEDDKEVIDYDVLKMIFKKSLKRTNFPKLWRRFRMNVNLK